jgi:3-carboxy-cis,cis-muconate cycloisomerase
MMMNSQLFSPLFSDPDIEPPLSDEQFIAHMLTVEGALAKAEGSLGIIPSDAADRILAALPTFKPDWSRLLKGVELSGVPTIELVRQLREHVGGEAASYVHWGATTQDIMDTALVLQLRAILDVVDGKLVRLIHHLAGLADQHRHTLMAGRTHSQQALPITFGLKVAGWLSPLLRHRTRLAELKPRLLVLQFGGGVGTLASLDDAGLRVQEELAKELELAVPVMPWHTQRDNVVEVAGWLSLVTGSLGKIGQDIILMAQSEVDELRESDDPARGGSSTMPQKSNPVISEVLIAAARTNAALLSAMHQALVQEHERATGGWQIEWLNLPQMLMLTGAALEKGIFLSQHLVVNGEQMRANVAASHGLMLAEALDLALAPIIGRSEAKKLVKTAAQTALNDNRHLVDVVREQTNITLDWDRLRDEANYLGVSDSFIEQVLNEVDRLS